MKKSKWLVPILIIIIFCIGLFFCNTVILGIFKNVTNKIDEMAIEKEKEKSFDLSESYDENTSNVVDVQVGNTYTAILKEDGSVWVTGTNTSYSGDYTYEGIKLNEFTKVKLDNVKQIGVGNEFVIALTNEGEVYSWGANSYSTLGTREIGVGPYQVPTKLDIENIEKIYVFGNQAGALSKDGIPYYWGYAADTYYEQESPIRTISNKKITDIFLCNSQYFFKTENDEIYGVGFDFDKLTNEINGWATDIVKVDIKNVKEIASYNGYEGNNMPVKYVLKKDGTVWILNTLKDEEDLEVKIEGLQNIDKIYPIKNENSAISTLLAIDTNGDLYKYNLNSKEGNIVKGTNSKISIDNVKDIKEKEGRILILKNDGTLYNLGYSVDDLKPHEEGFFLNYYSEPETLSITNTKLMAVGEDFVIVVDENNNIYRQGKNEKGQLGGGKLQNLQEIYITSPYYENINATESILIDPSMGYLDD